MDIDGFYASSSGTPQGEHTENRCYVRTFRCSRLAMSPYLAVRYQNSEAVPEGKEAKPRMRGRRPVHRATQTVCDAEQAPLLRASVVHAAPPAAPHMAELAQTEAQ